MTISKFSKFVGLACLALLLLNACSSDDDSISGDNDIPDSEKGKYADGFFVTNEGQFPNPGSVSFIASPLDSVEQNIFETVNDEDPGPVIQSMFFNQDSLGFVVSNGANRISIVNRYTFEGKGEIDADLEMPRYGVVIDENAYVTNQAGDGAYVAVIDIEDQSVEEKIDVPDAEYIFKSPEGQIYVQSASFDSGNQISVIDPDSKTVERTLKTEDELNSIAVSDDGVYALTPHKIETFDFDGDDTADAEIELDYENPAQNLVVDNHEIYYTVGNKVYTMDLDAKSAPEEALFEYESDSSFGMFYGFDVHDGKIYIADGGDFESDSFIEVHDTNGDLIKKLDVGIGPNGFYFNE